MTVWNGGVYSEYGWVSAAGTIIQNLSPRITSFFADPVAGPASLAVKFTCEATDADGAIAKYRWGIRG